MRISMLRDRTPTIRRSSGAAWSFALALGLALGATAQAKSPPVPPAEGAPLVVATSGDYAPFSTLQTGPPGDEKPGGFGPALIRAYAKDRGRTVEFVAFRWPQLLDQLEAGDFQVAVGGITVRPDRALAGRFTVPVARSGAVLLVPKGSSGLTTEALNRPDARIAVNQGGHLEKVTTARFDRARVLPIPDNAAVPQTLLSGRADAVVTDTQEAPYWSQLGDGLRVLPPFTRDRKAFFVADVPGLGADLDAWLIEKEADGTLARLRAEHLGEPLDALPTASPLQALLAAIDLRLGLMPAVAEAKRATGAPVDVPEREAKVLDAAVGGVRHARASHPGHSRSGSLSPAEEAAIRDLFRAQIEAAKAIQRTTLAQPRQDDAPHRDLDTVLRPALIRLGNQIAGLIVALPPNLRAADVREATARELSDQPLSSAQRDAIADAITALSFALPSS